MAATPPRAILIVVAACLTAMTAGIVIGHYGIPAHAPAQRSSGGGYVAPEQASPPATVTNVRAAIPALEAWNADHGSYEGATLAQLRRHYDYGLHDVKVVSATRDDYCLESRVGDSVASKHGPAGSVLPQACS